MPGLTEPATISHATGYLAQLHDRLTEHGLHARLLIQPQQPPRLRVINPDAATLTELISAAPLDGQWWFWWSWGERITPVDELTATTERIRHVLTPAGDSSPEIQHPHSGPSRADSARSRLPTRP
jgi:hypothetical protein